MGRLFRKVFQMQSSWYSSRLKAVINHVRKYKSLVFISSLDGQKKKLLNERKCPEAVVRKCSVKKLFLNISEHFQEKTYSEVSFYHSCRSQGLSSEFCEIFNDTHWENCVLFSSVQEWLVGCFWPFWCVYTINFYYTLYYTYKEYRCLENVIHQIDSKNEWLLLPASFTAKFGLVFVLTLENAFS